MMDEENRIITTSFTADDENESSLRPRFMVDYTGQEKIKDNLSVFIEAAACAATRSTMFCSTARRPWEDDARVGHSQ